MTVAIMTRLNELAERHGFAPSEFLATLASDELGDRTLHFAHVPADAEKAERFSRILRDLGITDDDVFTIHGTDAQVYALLHQALLRAPIVRGR